MTFILKPLNSKINFYKNFHLHNVEKYGHLRMRVCQERITRPENLCRSSSTVPPKHPT